MQSEETTTDQGRAMKMKREKCRLNICIPRLATGERTMDDDTSMQSHRAMC